MNWRRGLLLAGVNLVAAVPLICLLAAEDARYVKEWEQHSAIEETPWVDSSGEFSAAPTKIVQARMSRRSHFLHAVFWGHIPPQVSAVQLGNLPAFVLSQWREACPPRWSVAGMLGLQVAGLSSPDNVKAMRRVDVAVCLMIAIQWLLIGGFPLRQSNGWWAEPGAFITANNFIAACVAIIPAVDGLARLPALIAFGGWIWWFGLLVWIPVHKALQSTLGELRRLSN
ncbi:MAG: hypothetical protein WB561_20810 [Terracidiphilus sp.]